MGRQLVYYDIRYGIYYLIKELPFLNTTLVAEEYESNLFTSREFKRFIKDDELVFIGYL